MLTARLKAPPERQDRIVESAFFSFSDGTLWNGRGLELAKLTDGLWRCQNGMYISIDFESSVLVQLNNPETRDSEQLGPLPLRIIAGAMCRVDHEPKIIAEFDVPENAWFLTGRPEIPMQRFTITAAGSGG